MDNKIERVDDQDRLIIHNSIKYLDNLAQKKTLNVPTLQSLYRTKCRLMELRRQIFLPQQKPHERCQQCFMNFSEGNTKHEVQPVKLSHFAKQIINKVNKNLSLTNYQQIYYKKLLKKHPNGFQKQNKLILTCSFCNKETTVWMNKPKRKSLVPATPAVTPKKKKKVKKKDKFCGLDESVVMSSSIKKNKKKVNTALDNGSAKKKIKSDACKKLSSNTSNVFVTQEKSNLNATVCMVSSRDFQTADFIPLESNAKSKKRNIKLSKKKENINKPVSQDILKSKEKLKKKNRNSLSNLLKKANDSKSKPSSTLKNFLAGL